MPTMWHTDPVLFVLLCIQGATVAFMFLCVGMMVWHGWSDDDDA